MAPELHKRIREVFDEALDKPTDERLAHVRTVCAGDPTLLQAVERLLNAYDSSGSFLDDTNGRLERVGRYVIRGELGRGAMGVVYDAIDPLIGRTVAVKVINLCAVSEPRQAELLRDRLFKEAKSAGQLFHPGIVVILDVGQEGDLAYFTMERVEGRSLHQVLASGKKLEPAEALDIVRQAAVALDYAHQQGVVHRDIKPANILLETNGRVKVADFGIAKIMSASYQTATGLTMGTPSYMSPEQIEGHGVDGRTDQFSLGVMAFELLTGQKPFKADSIARMAYLVVSGERPSARAVNPQLPEAVDEALRRGLAKAPEERFRTCSELVSALDAAFVAARQQPVAKPPAIEPPAPKTGRYVVGGLLVAVVLAGSALVYRKVYVPPNPTLSPVVHAIAPAPVVRSFNANPTSIEPGKSATLSWDVAGARMVSITPDIGTAPLSGQQTVSPSASTTYVLTAAGSGPDVHATITVDVAPRLAASVRQLYDAAIAKGKAGRSKEALSLLREAADMGESAAMMNLGERYAEGDGVAKDSAAAVRWFRRAAEAGNTWGMLSLGAMYELGDGTTQSYEDAARWFQRATDRSNPSAMYDLGTLYERGQGVSRSMNLAKQLYRRAASLGNAEAKKRLTELEGSK